MKNFRPTIHPSQQIFAALILTGILSLGAGMILVNAAIADAGKQSQAAASEMLKPHSEDVASPKQSRKSEVPRSVVIAVRREIANTYKISASQLRIVSSSQQSWSDGCLGLGRPSEMCAQLFVQNGWRVVMSDGRQNWTYRTDNTGRSVRLESRKTASNSNLPDSVANAVLQFASKPLGVPSSRLRIIKAEQQTWRDSCLGLPRPVERCMGTPTPGWRVTVEGKQQVYVYRTDNSGSRVRAEENETGSLIKLEKEPTKGNSKTVPIPKSELPPPLSEGVVFRAIATGGFTGRTYETRLMKDGTVIRQIAQPTGVKAPAQTHQVSRQQVRQLQELLHKQRFSQFNQLSYPAPRGAADYISVTLTSQSGTTRYADIAQDQLPKPLQSVIQAWNQIASDR